MKNNNNNNTEIIGAIRKYAWLCLDRSLQIKF